MSLNLSLQQALKQVVKKLDTWFNYTFTMLPNLVVAIIALIIFWILGAVAERFAQRAVLRLSHRAHIARLLGRMVRLGVLALGLLLALNIMRLDRAVASLLAGAGILGIALGFASKDIFANFMSGVILHLVHPFKIGDMIKTGEILGYINTMDMRSTIIRNQQGQMITVPNQNLLGNPIINFTTSGVRRVDLPWSLTQVEDLAKAEELAIKAVESLEPPLRNPDREIELFYEKVGDYTIDFEIRFWTIPDQKTFLKARSEAIKAIKLIYEEHKIPMPSPVRVLDFGIVGGTTLREQLEGLRLPLARPEEMKGGEAPQNSQEKKAGEDE
jgi:small conductance mechanosensitive channel